MKTIDQNVIATILGKEAPIQKFELYMETRNVLVTGAGGFIGSALSKEIARLNPMTLVLVDHTEFSLYEVHRDIVDRFPGVAVVPILSDYGDMCFMTSIMSEFAIDTVFHVGAYKHVPMCERNVVPAIKNNVLGADELFHACELADVTDLIVVSSDKAVNPTNVMGATKRVVEYLGLATSMNVRVVRFGNVLWSTGSVLPLFQEQLLKDGKVTITHPEADRFFMTVQQAVGLILQSIALSRGIYCFDMGNPVSIETLARRLAHEMDVKIDPVYIGMRPGEKMHEELTLGEGLTSTPHPQILLANELQPPYGHVKSWVEKIKYAVKEHNVNRIRRLLGKIVPGYIPDEVVDDIWLSRVDDCFRPSTPAF